MEPYGNEPKNLTASRDQTEEWSPVFSSDGNSLYFVSEVEEKSEIYNLNLQNNEIKQLTDNKAPDWYPKVSSSGNKIAYICKDPSNTEGPDQICLMNPDGTNAELIPNQPKDGDNGDPLFSPDGHTLYFIHTDGEPKIYNLYSMNIDGSNVRRISNGNENILSPAIFTGTSPAR